MDYNQAVVQQILENRINGAGVGEATVQPKGQDQFVVELPDVQNKDAILKLLGTTAQLKFYYFRDVANPSDKLPAGPSQISDIRATPGKSDAGRAGARAVHVLRPAHQPVLPRRRADPGRLDAAAGAGPDQPARPAEQALCPPAADPSLAAALKTDQDPLTLTADTPVYFTPAQQAQADALNRELSNWNGLLAEFPAPPTAASPS